MRGDRNAWRLDTGGGLSRADVERLIEEGKVVVVSAVRLSGGLTGDFTFTVQR